MNNFKSPKITRKFRGNKEMVNKRRTGAVI
jgi:hypothetical protein